ncbi:MAG TPA: sigma-70 family RNA polymerase sigma factor [Kutzneria sp.]|jgi:RNA polymerase sigma-70 factor (ECF subfamily)|nr:sigma-70 family RNA polymerase sigma factor [Kutzneria sp.]
MMARRKGGEALVSEHPGEVSAALRAVREDGDENAFRVLYRAVQPGLLRYLRVLVGTDAEDVASEAWLHIARDLSTFKGDEDGFRGWAATIARNRALDHLRHQRRRPVNAATDEQLSEVPAREDTAESAVTAMDTDAALELISKLPRDQAEAVLLRAVMGLDAKAAAKVLGKRAGAVRMAAHRGLRTLADLIPETRRSAGGVTQNATPTLKQVR